MSDSVIARSATPETQSNMIAGMGRWEPNAQERLEEAALDLFAEQGYENTTVAEIAGRARLTDRTFYRYFADKREVLFGGSDMLVGILVAAVAAVPDSPPAIDVTVKAFVAAAPRFPDRRGYSRKRRAAIDANVELRERDLLKLASLASAIKGALLQRGIEDAEASLAADAGVAIFKVAFDAWIAKGNRRDLATLIEQTAAQMKAVAAAS